MLFRCQVAGDPDKPGLCFEFAKKLLAIEFRQFRDQLVGDFLGIKDGAGIGKKRGRRQARRKKNAVAINDVGAPGSDLRIGFYLRQPRFAAGLEYGQVHQAHADRRERQRQNDAGNQQTVAAGFHRLFAGTFDPAGTRGFSCGFSCRLRFSGGHRNPPRSQFAPSSASPIHRYRVSVKGYSPTSLWPCRFVGF